MCVIWAIVPISQSKLGVMRMIENVVQNLYIHYFFLSPKQTQEFVELVDILKTKGQQILKNIKTHYISLMPHLKEFWVNA